MRSGATKRTASAGLQALEKTLEYFLHWSLTHPQYHIIVLSTESTVVEHCFLFRCTAGTQFPDIIALQVHYSFRVGSLDFPKAEESAPKKFRSNLWSSTRPVESFPFNCLSRRHRKLEQYYCNQTDNIEDSAEYWRCRKYWSTARVHCHDDKTWFSKPCTAFCCTSDPRQSRWLQSTDIPKFREGGKIYEVM